MERCDRGVRGRRDEWPDRSLSRTVVARSAALMPVVVPRRASMDSVNAVPSAEVFTGDIGGRCSSSQRSSVSARQIRPRPCLAMKLIAAGVIFSAGRARSPSFSRSSSSTRTICRPWRNSSMASSTVAKRIGMNAILTQNPADEKLRACGARQFSKIPFIGHWRLPPWSHSLAATYRRQNFIFPLMVAGLAEAYFSDRFGIVHRGTVCRVWDIGSHSWCFTSVWLLVKRGQMAGHLHPAPVI